MPRAKGRPSRVRSPLTYETKLLHYMRNEIKGKIIAVPPVQRGQGQRGPWSIATVVIEYEDGRYMNKLALECRSNKAEEFGRLQVGQSGTFYYDVTSREYNGKFYTSANCFDWKIEGSQASSGGYQQGPI